MGSGSVPLVQAPVYRESWLHCTKLAMSKCGSCARSHDGNVETRDDRVVGWRRGARALIEDEIDSRSVGSVERVALAIASETIPNTPPNGALLCLLLFKRHKLPMGKDDREATAAAFGLAGSLVLTQVARERPGVSE